MSRVVEFAEAGGPEVLRFKNVDVPEAGPGQVRIRVKAIGLNRAESMWARSSLAENEWTLAHCQRHDPIGLGSQSRLDPAVARHR